MRITIRPGNTVKGQANMWNLLRGMAGNPILPTCSKCGGLPPESDGPLMGKCFCQKASSEPRPNIYADRCGLWLCDGAPVTVYEHLGELLATNGDLKDLVTDWHEYVAGELGRLPHWERVGECSREDCQAAVHNGALSECMRGGSAQAEPQGGNETL